eukprot:8584368-Prorocentrum_lima.AAC.1
MNYMGKEIQRRTTLIMLLAKKKAAQRQRPKKDQASKNAMATSTCRRSRRRGTDRKKLGSMADNREVQRSNTQSNKTNTGQARKTTT